MSANQSYPSHGGNLTWARKYYKKEELIDFSANINPLGCSNFIYQSITANLSLIEQYPDPECTSLKKELSLFYGVDEESIVVGNGASELLYLLCKAISPSKALTLAPSFSEYLKAAKACGASVEELVLHETNDFQLELPILKRRIAQYDLIFLCNPNNPVGNIYTRELIKDIADLCYEHKTYLLVDESFLDFVKNKARFSVLLEIKTNPYLIVLSSLTKFFALPGLRIGCCFGNKELIKKVKEIKDPWNVNCFAQLAGLVSLQDKDFQARSIEFITKEKERLYQELTKIPLLKVFYPSVNFILVKILTENMTSTKLTRLLAEK